MNEEAIKLLYEDISSEYEVGTIDEFKSYLLDSNKRSAFFNEVIKERYDVSNLDEFENAYGLKKKEATQPVSSEPQEPLQEASSGQPAEPLLESGKKAEEPQLSFESLPDVDAEISAIEKELEEVYANVDKQYTPEEIQSVKDKNARRLELSYKKDNFLAKEGAINVNGQYFSPEGFESELVKRYAITPTDQVLKNEGTPIYGKGYTHSNDLSEKESEINRLTKEIDDLGKDDYLRYHYSDLVAARKPLEEERLRLSKEYSQAVKSNNDILTYENGARYYEGDKELTQSEFYDAITSMRGTDKLSDGINNFRVENDPGMQDFLNFQEKYAKVGRAKEAVKGYLSTTKTFIDGVDIRQVEAYMGVAELFGVDPKEAAKAFSVKNYPGDPITKEPGYSVVSPVVTEAIKNASKRPGDFTDNFLQEYSKIIRKQTEDVRGHRMVREYDAIDRLMAGDFGGFAADATQLSVESAPFLVAAMAGTAGIGLIYNSVQAQSYYEYRDLGNSKARAMRLSNLKAAVETADALIERALFTKSITDAGKILNRANAWTKFGDGTTRKLASEIAVLHAKELPTEYAQGTIGSLIDQVAAGQMVDFWKASRDGMIEMIAAGPTTTVMSSPQIAQAIYAPIAKYKDIHNIRQDASRLLLELTVGEQDKKIVLNSLKGIVNDIITENKKVEDLDKVVTPEEKSILRDLTLQELTAEAALETGISKQSKEAIRNKLKDIERQKNELVNGAEKRSTESKKPVKGAISPESSKNYANLTEDEGGNFVFYHVSPEKIDETDPSRVGTAKHGATSSEEARELSKVGGVTMFYTRPEDGEQQVSGNYKHEFRVAKNKVYDFNSDPLNFAEEAKKRHEKEYPGKTYDANTQLAYITQIAGENGFDIVVSEWAGKTRAQTTQKLKPSDIQVSSNGTISKSFQDEFVSNTKKGWMQDEGVSPVNKLVDIYNKIYKIFNDAKDYGKLYKLGDLAQVKNDFDYKFQPFRSQEEVTEAINESDKIPQEIKDEYNAALSYQGVPPSSRLRYEDNPQTEPVDIDNSPDGTYINVGMMEEDSDKKLTKDDIIGALPRDIEVLEATELTAEESSGEPTLSLKLSRPLDADEMKAFRNRTKQKAVPQLHNKRGVMHGTLDWGNFNAEYFTLPDKQKLSEVKTATDETTDQEVEDLERMVKSRKSKNKKLELNQKLKERAIKEMNEMEDAQVEFKEPEGPKTTTNPLVNIAQKIKTYFGKPVKELVRKIEDFNGIPMFLGMSDMLAAGEILDIEGKPMTVNGGLLFGLTGGNKNLSWAGVDKSGAQVHLDKAKLLYERHKDLFERLWKEGKLPDGHIPMAIMRMANSAILSNEAIYRYVHPLLNKVTKTNNKKALSGFKSTIEDRIKSLSEKKKKSSSDIAELKSLSKINDFLKGQTSMADMIKSVYEDSITRSKTGKSKLNLSDKAVLTKRLFGSNEDTKSLDRQWVKDMFGDDKDVRSKLTIGNILNGIADPSVKEVSSGSIIGIMGIDVKHNPGVSRANHNNYGWGANGRIIALMENPTDGINVFPEFFAKAARLFEKKKDGLPSSSTILRQIGSTYFHDKAFLGTRPNEVMSEIDIISAKMRYAFPSVQFTSTQEEFDEAINEDGVREKRNSNGDIIAGITKDGKIHLNPSVATISTPIHEFAHIWMDYLRSEHSGKKGTELYEKGMELVEGTEELERAKELYPELDLEGQKEEALVELIATRGASIMEAGKKSKFLSWLNAMYEFIKKNFSTLDQLNKKGHKKIKDISLEDFADTALADLLSGKELSASFDPTLSDHAMSSRFSKKRQADMSMYDIVKEARLNNFTDGAIKRFLQKEGYAVKDIMDVLDVPIDTLTSVPKSFGLIEGGMNRGVNLYTEIRNKLKRLRGKSIGDIRAKAQEYLTQTDDYKNSSDTLQKQMAVDLDKSLAITQNKEVSSEMKAIRAELRARNRGAKELSSIKSKIRTFIRKNIPMSMFEKKEVMELVSSVTEATPENIQSIFKDVEDFVVKHGVKIAKKRIEKLLNIKLKKLESGRLKGNFLPEDQDLIEVLRGNLLSEDASIEDVQASIDSLRSKYNELDSKNNLTQREYDEMVMLDIAINYNNSLLMDENDVSKLQSLNYVKGAIEDVLTGARIEMKMALAQQKEYYNKIKGEFFKDVTGLDIDFNDEASVLEARQKIRDRQAKKDNRSKFVKYLKNFFGTFDGVIIRIEGMEGLLDRVSRMPGEMFEGKSTELILDKIDESNANFKAGKREIMSKLDQKAKEIFGDKYRSLMQKNSKPTEYYYSNPKKVDELFVKLEEAKSDKEKGKIQKDIDTYRMPISQNEMYYIYNQYKDEANHPGLEATFGPQYGDIISLIEHKLDPKVKQWADWQVEEFFPSVYDRYNSVYREVYRTDMPWNENYAGRIHRDGDADQVNLLENTDQYQTSVGGGSTKVRIKNKKKIKVVDGDTNLNMYINEMEFFASYAESVRDISKMIGNPDIKDGIIATTGKEAYVVLKTQFDKIMNRNSAKGSDIKILNTLSNAFVKAKLGLSPVIFLKQTTSALAFADYIGYRNWSKNMLSSDLSKQWKELYENSVYLQDRYEVSDIAKVLEDYTSKDQTSFLSGVQADKLNNFLMYMIKQGDKMGVMGSIPNYKYYKELYMSRGMTKSDAIALAVKKTERQIKTTQQSSDIQDKDLLQTSGPLMRMLNLFLSSPRALMRKEVISIRNLYRKMRGEASKGSTYENLRTFFTYHVVIPSFFQFVSLGFPGLLRDWRDDDSEDMAWAMLLGNINAVFAFGDIAVAVKDTITNKPWAGNMRNLPMFQNIEDIFDSYSKFMKAKTDETRAKYMTKLFVQIAEPASGIPINNIMKFGNNYSKLATGDVDNFGEALLRFFNYSDYVIEGPKEKKSTSKSTSSRTSRRQTSRRSRD